MVQASEPPQEHEHRPLVSALYTAVRRAHRLREHRVHSRCDKAGLVLLGQLAEHGPLRLSELASGVQLDVSTVSRQVKALCDGGFVEVADDPDDRRARVLQLTAKGRTEIDTVLNELGDVLGHALDGWSARDVAALTGLLQRLAHDLAAEQASAHEPAVGARGSPQHLTALPAHRHDAQADRGQATETLLEETTR